MKTITLYTDSSGYRLYKRGATFIASADKRENDYLVVAPIENVIEFPLEDDLECYDIIKLNGVIVEEISN